MSGRIEKSRQPSKKTEERHRLVALIDSFGIDIMPCSFCSDRGLHCRMMEGVSRCKECVRRGRSCDGVLEASSVQKILSAEERLKLEEEETEEKLLAAQQALNEAVSRLLRIRKQRASLKTRGVEMARRGAHSLDELDAKERVEAAEEERRRATEAVPAPSDLPIFSDDFMNGWDGTFPEADLDPSVLAQFGLADGRVPTLPSGSSGGQ